MILGIGFSHNATACIVDPADGSIVFCCSEERFTRRKNEWGIPVKVLQHIFEKVVAPGNITVVAVGESCDAAYGCAEFASLVNLENYAARDARIRAKAGFLRLAAQEWLLRAAGRRIPLRELVRARLQHLGVGAPVTFTGHHAAHAAAAYYGSPYDNALVLTLDGEGDGLSGSCWRGQGPVLTPLGTLSERQSLGLFYRSITALLGFKVNQQEGQVLGLAASGDPNRFHEAFARVLRAEASGGRLKIVSMAADHHLDMFSRRSVHFLRLLRAVPMALKTEGWQSLLNSILAAEFARFYSDVTNKPLYQIDPSTSADIAAAAQMCFEEAALAVFRCFKSQAHSRNVAVAGGVFANVQLNRRILQLPGVDGIHVHPGMGDEGLAVGAAFAIAHKTRSTKFARSSLQHVFLGSGFSDGDAERALASFGAPSFTAGDEELAARTAAALADGCIVGVARGRSEYGPRALGNRSILADPRERHVCDLLNRGLHRSPMMPFAPAVIDSCFDDILDTDATPGALHAAPFMTITLDVRPAWRERIPAVVHLDGTARPQWVSASENPFLHAVITRFRQLTGVGCVLNTSLNRHNEPIVNTPGEAICLLNDGPLNFLVLGSCWAAAPGLAVQPVPRSLRAS